MSHMGQSRHFDRGPATSDLPPGTDIVSPGRHVSNLPKTELAGMAALGAQSGTSVGGLSQRRATLGLRRTFELRLRVRQRRTWSDGVDEVRLAPRSERPLPPRSP